MRATDVEPVKCFRSDRFFVVAGGWYFTTREGEEFGPFPSRAEAERRLARYLDTQSIIHYLRGNDPLTESGESSEQLVARLSVALNRLAPTSREVLAAR